ncbi:MAG: type I DNA topoisomerase [Balneolaceae bacterium]
MKSLVIVESPTKTKTIKKYLPKGFQVDSSMGHIRDLPSSAKEIPAKYKKEDWSNLGINVETDFEPIYVVPGDKKKVVKKLRQLLKDCDELILATDEDREGEAISWHLIEVLKPKVPVKRMVFREITEEAIIKAMENYRDIDMNLVHAQETRRIIDRLAGYTISPLLWKKISPGLSAGRVQSVAVSFLVERERERMKFRSGKYFDLKASLNKKGEKEIFPAVLSRLDGMRLASGKDFDESTGKLKKPDSVVLLDEKKANDLRDKLHEAEWKVTSIDVKTQKRNPSPPFITSTLQQEANRKLGMSARNAMGVAQKLYENGLITYMRTDSTNLSGQAINAARNEVEKQYGKDYLFERVRNYSSGSKTAQEAHEAIRPAGSSFIHPEKAGLTGQQFKLYDLIWKRTIATQMAEAELEFTNAVITAGSGGTEAEFRASGKKILFPGFFRAYVEGSDDPESALENQEIRLPELVEGDETELNELESISHETKPPARFTEATLVKELEKRGIGRPSTYASIISTVQDRGYVSTDGKTLIPTYTAFAVTALLENHFPDLVDSEFTSEMENKLDQIAQGGFDPAVYLSEYYKGDLGLKSKVESQEDKIDPQEARKLELPIEGLNGIGVYVGRFGPYVKTKKDEEEISTSLPVGLAPGDITITKLNELINAEKKGPESLGKHPETGEDVFVLTGRFGPYVQLGEVTDENKKPKRVSLLKGMKPEDVDMDLALQLLELPRTLGTHPETGKDVKAGVGRYGPFVLHDGTFKSLTKDDNVLTVELSRAVELLKQKKTKRSSSEIKELGEHPENSNKIRVMDGRYGPYLKYGKKNVSLPGNVKPEEVTLDQAVEIIAEKGKK